ncbi:hypothetical protein BD309DRAFT_750908 [Dichomitus squalens]|uniref:Uncharacterized protein n=1 Tax=Dichomitus squalens TaxID=114155 RepID=A0A4Q9PIG2_9APHY|nr:hypothetical protein BD309DRAFT_750908 [Dichomitus squalens]TBU53326.1 hypothetical protein BD310DRAFT_938241 [Dichomitus squalens]
MAGGHSRPALSSGRSLVQIARLSAPARIGLSQREGAGGAVRSSIGPVLHRSPADPLSHPRPQRELSNVSHGSRTSSATTASLPGHPPIFVRRVHAPTNLFPSPALETRPRPTGPRAEISLGRAVREARRQWAQIRAKYEPENTAAASPGILSTEGRDSWTTTS